MTAPQELAPIPITSVAVNGEFSVAQIIEQTRKVKMCLDAVMIKDEHYGIIPGCKKPSLWKPGAEKLCLMFRLDPQYKIVSQTRTADLIEFVVETTLFHIPTGNRIASGLGSCNSREEKYRRPAPKLCPECSKPAIIKGKEEYGGGWLCFKKKDGCGAKFKDGDKSIEEQASGVADPSDLHNTILKMACKRALIAAVLNGTAASDCFAQDLEDLPAQFIEQQPTGPNVPAARPNGPGAPPRAEYVPPVVGHAEQADDDYAATMRDGPAPDEPPQQTILNDKWVQVINLETGEVTKEKRPTPTRFKRLQCLRSDLKINEADWKKGLKQYQVDSSTLLTMAQCEHYIARLEKWEKAQQEARGVPKMEKEPMPTAEEIEAEQQEDKGDVPEEMR